MANGNLEEILKRKKEKAQAETKIDWNARKKEWILHVNKFYEKVENWLNPFIKKDFLNIKKEKIQISEEHIGTYDIDQMVIEMHDEKAVLSPVGTLIFGAIGRIDMRGNCGIARFVLVGKKLDQPNIEVRTYLSGKERKRDEEKRKQQAKTPVEYVWKFATPPPRIKYIELNKDSFSDLFSQVING